MHKKGLSADKTSPIFHPAPIYSVVRRIVELVMLIGLAPIWLTVMLILAVLIKLDSPGPIFFIQERVGQYDRLFRMYKFRSMRQSEPNAEAGFASDHEHRITRLGQAMRKSRLDELPQFLNIMKGDMSLIGPRPEQPSFVKQFEREIQFYSRRHLVRPGITGLAQVYSGYADDAESTYRKVRYDWYFIRNLSPRLDALIVFKTIQTMFTGFGAK